MSSETWLGRDETRPTLTETRVSASIGGNPAHRVQLDSLDSNGVGCQQRQCFEWRTFAGAEHSAIVLYVARQPNSALCPLVRNVAVFRACVGPLQWTSSELRATVQSMPIIDDAEVRACMAQSQQRRGKAAPSMVRSIVGLIG